MKHVRSSCADDYGFVFSLASAGVYAYTGTYACAYALVKTSL